MKGRLLQLDDVRRIDTPENVASLFQKIGYNASAQQLAIDDLELPARSAEAIWNAYMIADHQHGNESLQVLLFQLQDSEWQSPSVASNRMRSLAQSLCRRPSNFLLLGTKNYDQLMLVNPRKSFDADMNLKVSIRKLLIDRSNPTNYDRDRLDAIAARNLSPQELYKVQCEAFDVEKLTKDFYRGYREIFEELQRVIKANNQHPYFNDSNRLHQFSQRLLGRVMFLYFLQKKEFLAGDRNFLKNQYKRLRSDLEDTDFYTQVLEPLFFEMLNKQRPNMDSPWGKIPYLNGGLFERDYGSGVIDAGGVETPPQIELPNSVFDPSSDKSILKFFNSYNFTVSENVQGDEDVAVDPEMLGKVFENMLAAEERGQSGTFYTPRGIVQFMCVESLSRYLADSTGMDLEAVKKLTEYDSELPGQDINQLLTKEQAKKLKQALDAVKICDPAVGSGAFPMGMMQVILSVKQAIAHRTDGRPVQRGSLTISQWKRDIIANNLYGVDIKPEAVEIAKLRMWLSLVVDIPDLDDVEPLPNLDYKLMCGDSLISTIQGEQLIPDPTKDKQQLELNVTPIQAAIQPLIDLQHKYFEAHAQERQILRGKILEAEKNVFRVALADRLQYWQIEQRNLEQDIRRLKGKASKAQTQKQQTIAAKLQELERIAAEVERGMRSLNFFQWHLHFNEVFQQQGGFDIVIGNPPYVGQKGNKEIFEEIKLGSLGRFFHRGMDLLYFFFHLSLDISKNNGYIALITTNYYLTADSAKNLRKDLANRANFLKIINFNELRIFSSAKGQHNAISLFRKSNINKIYNITKILISQRNSDAKDDTITKFLNEEDREAIYIEKQEKTLYDENLYIRIIETFQSNNNDFIAFTNSQISALDIIQKIKNNSDILLGDMCNINPGVQSGADKVSQQHIDQGLISATLKEHGIYVLSKKELSSLKLSNPELEIIKPFFKNSDIKKYCCLTEAQKFLIYATRDLDIQKYPQIYNHFLKFENIIKGRDSNRGEMQAALKLGKWWVVRVATKNPEKFIGEKIVCPQRSKTNSFAYNNVEWYSSADVYIITLKDQKFLIKYILGLLNSKLYYFWLYFMGKRKGNSLELYYTPLSTIPIKSVPEVKQKLIEGIVNKIIDAKQHNFSTDTYQMEAEIDNIVYELYGLTNEDISIIENLFSK